MAILSRNQKNNIKDLVQAMEVDETDLECEIVSFGAEHLSVSERELTDDGELKKLEMQKEEVIKLIRADGIHEYISSIDEDVSKNDYDDHEIEKFNKYAIQFIKGLTL